MRHSGLRGRVRANPGSPASAAGSAPAPGSPGGSASAPDRGGAVGGGGRRDAFERLQAALSQRHHEVHHGALLAVHALAQFGDLLVLAVSRISSRMVSRNSSSTVCRRASMVLAICSSTRRARVSANSLWTAVICARSAAHVGVDALALRGHGLDDFTAQSVDPGLDAFGQFVVLRVQLVEFRLDLAFEFGQSPVDAGRRFRRTVRRWPSARRRRPVVERVRAGQRVAGSGAPGALLHFGDPLVGGRCSGVADRWRPGAPRCA